MLQIKIHTLLFLLVWTPVYPSLSYAEEPQLLSFGRLRYFSNNMASLYLHIDPESDVWLQQQGVWMVGEVVVW